MKGETAVGIDMKGETAAEGDMKAGIDSTETDPTVVMAGDKGHTVEAEAHTMTKEGTILAEAAAETTETAMIDMKGEIAGIEGIIIGIGEIIAQTEEIEAGGDMKEARVGGDMKEAGVGGEMNIKVAWTLMSNASDVANMAILQFTARILDRHAPSVGRWARQSYGGSKGIRPGGYLERGENRHRQGFRERAQSLENQPRDGWVTVTPNHRAVITHAHTHTGVCRRRDEEITLM